MIYLHVVLLNYRILLDLFSYYMALETSNIARWQVAILVHMRLVGIYVLFYAVLSFRS
jgi:hypothetical protein